MGLCLERRGFADYHVKVVTGDRIGDRSNVDVQLSLIDTNNAIFANTFFLKNKSCSCRPSNDYYLTLPRDYLKIKRVNMIKFTRDDKGRGLRWFIECIHVTDLQTGEKHTFPVFRWIKPFFYYTVREYGVVLPQYDLDLNQRVALRSENKREYVLSSRGVGLPAQALTIPDDEEFSWNNKWKLERRGADILHHTKYSNVLALKWERIDQLMNIYTHQLPLPACSDTWMDDCHFGRLRTSGCGYGSLKLCAKIPDKLQVTDDMLQPFLEQYTLETALARNKLFIIDLDILSGVICRQDFKICSPICLFYETTKKHLVPIAIQLYQRPGPDNPVFLPSDSLYTWTLAKMWFNNADAAYHQCCTHIGFTHMLMEGICVSVNRQLGKKHPVFQLLAPHLLYLIGMNARLLTVLLTPGGWIDKTTNYGASGLFEIVRRGMKRWKLDIDGVLPANLKSRGLYEGVLSYFPFRQDALLLYSVINSYVTKFVAHYYDSPEKLWHDDEIQSWAKELILDKQVGGLGLHGVPGDGKFTSPDQLVTVVTFIIHTCSVLHSAANNPMYEQYAFTPNYPALLRGAPPKTKKYGRLFARKRDVKESEILAALPDKSTTLDIMVTTKLLCEGHAHGLGNFEVNFMFEPAGSETSYVERQTLSIAGTEPGFTHIHIFYLGMSLTRSQCSSADVISRQTQRVKDCQVSKPITSSERIVQNEQGSSSSLYGAGLCTTR